MKVTGGAFKEFSSGDECRQSARAVRGRLNNLREPAAEPIGAEPVSEAALAIAIELEGDAPPLVAINAIVEATALKFGLTLVEAMTSLVSEAVTARKIGAALVVRRLEIDAAKVAKLLGMPRDAIVDGLLLVDPVLRYHAIPQRAPLADVLRLVLDAQAILTEQRKISVAEIQRAASVEFGIPMNDLLSGRRTWNICVPRQIAMAIAKRLTLRSLPDLGRRFGGRDHTTVLHAVVKYQALVDKVAPEMAPTATALDWIRAVRHGLPGFEPFKPKRYGHPPKTSRRPGAGSKFFPTDTRAA